MLTWLACRLAPALTPLTEAPPCPPPEPHPAPDPATRATAVLAEMEGLPFNPAGRCSPERYLLGMGCSDLTTREADQNPDTAGRTPKYESLGGFEPVEIPGHAGVILRGHHSVGPPGQPVVIVVHGMNDSHVTSYVVEHSEVLRRMGFHVFALDMRDHGLLRGSGPPLSMGFHEGKDLFAAARTLSRREGVSVGILGISLGGQCAVRAAHEATEAGEPEVLRGGVATVCAPLNVHEAVNGLDDPSRLRRGETLFDRMIMKGTHDELRRHLRLRAVERDPRGPACRNFESYIRRAVLPAYPGVPPMMGAFLGMARCTQESVLGAVAVPTFILHSEDDPLVSVIHAEQAATAAAGNPLVGVRIVPKGGHVALGYEDPQGYLGMITHWFGRLADG